VVSESVAFLDDAARSSAQLAAYSELRTALGPPDALSRIARFMLEQAFA
jgi:hypothetical protein